MKHYILVDKKPVEVNVIDDIQKIVSFEKSGDKIIKQETLGEFWISTVFLMLDHRYGTGEPILYETMIFSTNPTPIKYKNWQIDDYSQSPYEHYQTRCSTYEQAEQMHLKAVKSVRSYNGFLYANQVIKFGVTAIITILLIYLVL